jgi:menaquinol-cytochrome c reductase iron-sulfur subunit
VPLDNPEVQPTTRRTFLARLSAAAAAVTTALAGIPSLIAFISPTFKRPSTERWVRLGEAALFDIGVPFKRDFTETFVDAWVESRSLKSVWLYTEDGESFTAYNGRCTHLGCGYSYDKGEGVFHCPCHHGLFDLKTGAVVGGPPPRSLDRLEVKVEDGNVLVLYKDYRIGIAEQVEA